MSKLVRVYLKNLSEVREALTQGTKVWYVDRDTQGYYFILENGLINLYNSGYRLEQINSTIYDTHKFFIRENKQVELRIGEFYRTRANKKVVCTFYDDDMQDRKYQMSVRGSNKTFYVDKNGGAFMAEDDIKDYWSDQDE